MSSTQTVNRVSGMYLRLRPRTRELLDSSALDKKDFTHRLNIVLIDWTRNGGTLEEFYEEFERHALRESFTPALGNYQNVIRKAYNSAADFTDRPGDPVALREKLIKLRERVAAWDLYGERKYRRPRETWLVMLDILIEDMQSDWNRGYRRLATEAGLGSPQTAQNHVVVAMSDEIDLIRDETPELTPEEIDRGVPRPVSRLAFNLDWMEGELLALPVQEEEKKGKLLDNTSRDIPIECVVHFLSLFTSEVWTHCLGTNRKPTYEALSEEPARVSEIAAAAGLSAPTVRAHLEFLEGKGVVIREPAPKGRGYVYRINPDPDLETIEREAAYWKAESEARFERERTDFNAYSTVWYLFYERGNYPLVSDGDRPYRLSPEGLEYARGKRKAWEHHQIPEQYREYTEEGDPLRGLWALPDGEVFEVKQGPPPVSAEWFDYLDEDRPAPIIPHGVDPWG